MTMLENYYEQAKLSRAAYALNLQSGEITNIQPLLNRGFTKIQAEDFAKRYTVLSSQQNTSSGFSATIFQDNETGINHLAIRGTEVSIGDFVADALILNGTPAELNPQYIALTGQVNTWLSNGEFTPEFTVT